MRGIICRFFHNIHTLDDAYFKELPSGKWVKLFYCEKCDLKYMAYNKRALLRVISKL
jgi:hypothetical protein